ncbi:MAG TPA: acyl-CoA thioesterase domain-containing protein [Caulobacteraceae bacterium]|jgi:acyl-coenzyme A thioesterase PaaI-like protein
MPVFEWDRCEEFWVPTPLARGPFAGLQGGAVAGLLTAEAERLASANGFGAGVNVSAWFLRPVPVTPLRTQLTVLHAKGRLAVIDSGLFAADGDEPLATARVTFMAGRDLSSLAPPLTAIEASLDPATLPENRRPSMHGGPWMMDAMEARRGPDGVFWFRPTTPMIEGAGPLASVLGPADWAHGLGRPIEKLFADPNPTLDVHLLRRPLNGWVGVRAKAHWRPEVGGGFGAGVLIDPLGEIGAVSMAVALSPFPKPAAA